MRVLLLLHGYLGAVAGSQADPLTPGGVGLATIGGVLMGVGAYENDASGHLIWANPWFAGGCVLVACGIVLVVFPLISTWLRRQPDLAQPDSSGELGKGLAHLVPDAAPPSPLYLKLVDETWRLVYNAVWVIGLQIRVTNLTDKPVILTGCYLAPHSGIRRPLPLAERVWTSVNALLKELKTEHESEQFAEEAMVPPIGSITRWIFGTSYIPQQGGRPSCTFGMKDALDNDYKLDIPARAPETYHSQSLASDACADRSEPFRLGFLWRPL